MLKIFIKKWVFLFILVIFNLIIGLRTSIEFFYFFFWLLSAVIAISLLWIFLEYINVGINITRKAVNKLDEDGLLEIEAAINNNSYLPLVSFILEDNLACADPQERKKLFLIDYLGPRGSFRLGYDCLCSQRGKYRLGPFTVYFCDPLGLFFLKRAYNVFSDIYVYPKTFNIRKFPRLVRGSLPWFGIETARLSGDDDEFFGIREYKDGDPIRRIHWFSTARKNRLIVKQFQSQNYFRATIIFNLNKDNNFGEGKENVAEYIIKIVASTAKYLLKEGVSLEIIAHVGEIVRIPFNKGPEHLEEILRFLTVAQAESRINLGEIFEEFNRYVPNDSSLIVVMLDKEWEHLQAMFSLSQRNISLIPLILTSSTFLYSVITQRTEITRDVGLKLSRDLNFTPILFSRGENLEEVFLKI